MGTIFTRENCRLINKVYADLAYIKLDWCDKIDRASLTYGSRALLRLLLTDKLVQAGLEDS